MLADVGVPEELLFGGQSDSVGGSRKTEVVPEGKVVAFNEEVVFQVILYFCDLLVLLYFCFVAGLFLFEGQKGDSFYFVNGIAFDPTYFLTDFDQQQEMFFEDGEDSQEGRADHSLFWVGRHWLILVWVG